MSPLTFFDLFSRGTFRMEREDGYAFDIRIPPFSLESNQQDDNNNGSNDSTNNL